MIWERFRSRRRAAAADIKAVEAEPTEVPPELRIGIDHGGAFIYDALEAAHGAVQPQRYFEIGTDTGASLRISRCASLAVDPRFRLGSDVLGTKPACFFHQTTSDDFFALHDPSAILRGPIDLAYLDGLHHFEFLLRDFVNTERHCRRESVILLHDCIPTDLFMVRRQHDDMALAPRMPPPLRNLWAGDVWKTLAILMTHRPDLTISCFDTPPTGLVAVTGLDPTGEKGRAIPMAEVLSEYGSLDLPDFGIGRFKAMLDLKGTGGIPAVLRRD